MQAAQHAGAHYEQWVHEILEENDRQKGQIQNLQGQLAAKDEENRALRRQLELERQLNNYEVNTQASPPPARTASAPPLSPRPSPPAARPPLFAPQHNIAGPSTPHMQWEPRANALYAPDGAEARRVLQGVHSSKRKRPGNEPKEPLNSLFQFKTAAGLRTGHGMAADAKAAGAEWRAMQEHERQDWGALTREDSERYKQRRAIYDAQVLLRRHGGH